MKRNVMSLIGVLLMVAMLLSLTGCNKKEATPEATTEVTQQAVDSPYELNMKNYESFIKSLPAGGYYAFAAMDKDHDALLVTDAVFQDGDKTLASEATVYGYDKDGNIVEYGDVLGGGTAYPLSVKDNNLYFGNKTSMTKVTIEEYRNAMRIVDRETEGAALDALYAEFEDATPVEFTKVEGSTIPGPTLYEGTWAEKTSERVVIVVEPTSEKGWFDVTITWREALPQKDLYTMRAHYQKDGSLFYDNCRYLVRTFSDDGKYKDDVKYTNGSGLLKLDLADKVLYWTDYKASPGEGSQAFIKNDSLKIETVTAKATTKTTAKTTAKKAETTKAATKKAETTKASTKKAETTKAAPAEEDGQNPVMNFIGRYGYGRCTIDVDCQGKKDAHFHVTWGSSAAETSEWTMSGTFDEKTQSVRYTNGVKRTTVFNEDGTVAVSTVEYTGGRGTFTFHDNGALTWSDSQEHIADGMTFTY